MPSLTATGLQMNWVNVTITPQTGGAITLTKVMRVRAIRSTNQKAFFGDNNSFPIALRNTQNVRGVTIESGDLNSVLAIPFGVPCTVVATLCDAFNGALTGGGGKIYTWANAVMSDNGGEGANNEWAGGAVTFMCYSNDGVVDPNTAAAA